MKEPVCQELSVYYIRVAGLVFIHIRKLVSLSNSLINLGEMSTLSPRLFLYRNTRLLHILALLHTVADAPLLASLGVLAQRARDVGKATTLNNYLWSSS